jgi:hypothetical protein
MRATTAVPLCGALFVVMMTVGGCEGDRPAVPTTTIICDPNSGTQTCPPSLPQCHPLAGICVGCLSDFQTCDAMSFGPKKTCDPVSNMCVPADPQAPCLRNADCPRPGFDAAGAIVCEVDTGVCVGCVDDTDCVTPDTCIKSLHMCLTYSPSAERLDHHVARIERDRSAFPTE